MEQLRNKKSVIASGGDGTTPVRWAPRVTTLFYTVILLAIVAYIVFYVQDRARFFRTSGIVATEVTPVAAARDGRVTEIIPAAGDSVRRGDHLMTVAPGVDCAPADTTRLVNMALDLRLAEARREIVANRIASREARAATLDARRALELGREFAAERARLAREIEELESDFALLGTEIAVRRRALAESSGSIVSTDTRCFPEHVLSPIDGRVHELVRAPFSVNDAGTPVLSLTGRDADVRVVAQAAEGLIKNVYRGKEVEVRFPDGSRGVGVVHEIRAAADVVDVLAIDTYQLTETEIVMVIVPRDASDSSIWREYERLPVEVRGRRGRR